MQILDTAYSKTQQKGVSQKKIWSENVWATSYTHPLDMDICHTYFTKESLILDMGCGNGRVVDKLRQSGYTKAVGYDTRPSRMENGKTDHRLPVYYSTKTEDISCEDESADGILLFAVLTCIPSNKGQSDLIKFLYSKLKTGGILYVSDYYLQKDALRMGIYEYLENNRDNFGIFRSPEGPMRHHTREWIRRLFKDYNKLSEIPLHLPTNRGDHASAFQLVLQK